MQGFGGPSGYKPWRARMSAKFNPAAFTRIRTWPLAGTGSGRSSTFSTLTSPLRVVTIARIRRYRLGFSDNGRGTACRAPYDNGTRKSSRGVSLTLLGCLSLRLIRLWHDTQIRFQGLPATG